MRTAFINQLIEEAERHPEIVLLTGDLGYSVVEPFRDRFPDRFYNVGIAEQAMAGIAAGLAREGLNVYIYSIGNFPTLRCMEQLRLDVAYHRLSVKVVAVGAGYAYGAMGASHHATEDVAMMRALPDCVVAVPGDPVEAAAVTALSASHHGMMYIRLGKARETVVHGASPRGASPHPLLKEGELVPGDILPVKVAAPVGHGALPGAPRLAMARPPAPPQEASRAVLACGSILADVAATVTDADIYSLVFVKPIDSEALMRLAATYSEITVIEEHQLSGGAGSAVVEALSDLYAAGTLPRMPRVHRVAIPDTFCHTAGSQQYLRHLMGLTL